MCILLVLVLYPQDTLAELQFVFFSFVNLMTILLGAVL